jgi:phenylalanyl-tRNA synthetase beta chain
MPTIDVSYEDLCGLVDKKFTLNQLKKALEYVKGEIESKEGKRLKIEIADTNRPDLWSVEGIARELRTKYTKDKGMIKYKTNPSKVKVIIDKNLKNIRPLTVCAVIKGLKITDEVLFQMIQLQEKMCETFGRNRREVALGVYDLHKVSPPITFKAFRPREIKFVPLDFEKELYLDEILARHPKGKEYAHLLEGFDKYPIFIDSKKQVLSMPPIINSDYTGKVTKQTKDLFIECSGFNLRFLLPALNIMVAALVDRGGKAESVEVVLPDKKISTPDLTPKKIIFNMEEIKRLSGLNLKLGEIKKLLSEARYDMVVKGKELEVFYPAYRQDIMHPVDVIEDIIIGYGYNNIKPVIPKLATTGRISPINEFSRDVSEIMIGLGAQEIMSYILTNKNSLIEKMNLKEVDVIELENPVSENWNVFRTWIIPSLMQFLSKNKSREYPQQIFEIGEVVIPDKSSGVKSKNPVRLAWCKADKQADFTHAKQALDFVMRSLGMDYKIIETKHDSFIPGRVGRVVSKGKKIAYIGEMHPQVLENWGLEIPVAAFELNLTDLLGILNDDF